MGLAETGKTPAAQAIAMSMSEYWVLRDGLNDVAPSYRIAASLDQFRGEPGLKHRPDILDDADVSTIPPTKMKAFLDQSLEEAFTVERWTAAKFVRNQLRIVCVIRLQKKWLPKNRLYSTCLSMPVFFPLCHAMPCLLRTTRSMKGWSLSYP